jgi:hypothetical protein
MYYSLNAHTLEELQKIIAELKSTGRTRKSTRSCE